MTIQDCWRSRDRQSEQEAVRELLDKMNISVIEIEQNHAHTRFVAPAYYAHNRQEIP